MRWLVVALLIACGPGVSGVRDPLDLNAKRHDLAAGLVRASREHDVAALRELLRDHVTIGGMWFDDVKCMVRFAAPARVTDPALDEFARCLATLDLAVSSRTDALPDVVILTYGTGLELEARFIETRDGPWLNWIGYVARRDLHDALPTVSASALEALRVEGDSMAPLAGPGTFDELLITKVAYTWLKVCVDNTGAVTSANVREASSPKAARVFASAAQTWKFRPFILRSQPAPVCAMIRMRYPVDPPPKGEILPLPLPSTTTAFTNVPNQALGKRVAGEIMVSPDDIDKTRIQRAGIGRVIGAVHFCIDTSGHVDHASLIRSTGVEGYDRKLVAKVGTWVYAPYLDEGKPVGVCSSVHFIYSQTPSRSVRGPMQFGPDRR
jgi:hypothetical protein